MAKQQTNKQYNAEQLLGEFSTKSAVIRYLNSEGLTRSQIAKTLGIRYQHVRNVLITPLKRNQE